MTRLFAPFAQAESSTARRFGGSGLGLAIGRRLITLLGGDLAMTSEPGIGTRVTVDLTLPVVTGVARSAVAALCPATTPALDVLVAEDNAINRELVAAQLQRLGHRATIVEDGEQALLTAAAGRFDVLLTDLQMPRLDGHALARALRKDDALLPIIAMTANALPEERERCTASGMDGFVSKPVRLDALRGALASIASRDDVWDIEALREDFGSLAALPAMVDRFATSVRADIAAATRLHGARELAEWSHRVGGGLRVFGPSRASTMLERFENELRGNGADAAVLRLPAVLVALRKHVERLVEASRNLSED